jgi:hypothetical protein
MGLVVMQTDWEATRLTEEAMLFGFLPSFQWALELIVYQDGVSLERKY